MVLAAKFLSQPRIKQMTRICSVPAGRWSSEVRCLLFDTRRQNMKVLPLLHPYRVYGLAW